MLQIGAKVLTHCSPYDSQCAALGSGPLERPSIAEHFQLALTSKDEEVK